MNGAYLHLLINHATLFLIPVVLCFLIFLKTPEAKKLAYILLFLSSLSIVPIYLTGEPAEDVAEKWVTQAEKLIEPHEEAAETALVLTLILAAASAYGIWKPTDKKAQVAVLVLGLISVASIGYTSYEGGKIRHPEAHNPVQAPIPESAEAPTK